MEVGKGRKEAGRGVRRGGKQLETKTERADQRREGAETLLFADSGSHPALASPATESDLLLTWRLETLHRPRRIGVRVVPSACRQGGGRPDGGHAGDVGLMSSVTLSCCSPGLRGQNLLQCLISVRVLPWKPALRPPPALHSEPIPALPDQMPAAATSQELWHQRWYHGPQSTWDNPAAGQHFSSLKLSTQDPEPPCHLLAPVPQEPNWGCRCSGSYRFTSFRERSHL